MKFWYEKGIFILKFQINFIITNLKFKFEWLIHMNKSFNHNNLEQLYTC